MLGFTTCPCSSFSKDDDAASHVPGDGESNSEPETVDPDRVLARARARGRKTKRYS